MQLVQMWTKLAAHGQDNEADFIFSGVTETSVSVSAVHASAGVLSVTLRKCQQKFKTTVCSSTALKVLGFGDEVS